jgi:rubrerythrin
MERFIKRKNIEHYRDLLKTISDPARRRTIEKLLREEKAKLKKFEENRKNG